MPLTELTVDLMVRIVKGGKFTIKDRIDAAAWLADLGWGKAKDDACAPARPERPAVVTCLLCQAQSPNLPTIKRGENWMLTHAASKHPEHLTRFGTMVLRGPKSLRY